MSRAQRLGLVALAVVVAAVAFVIARPSDDDGKDATPTARETSSNGGGPSTGRAEAAKPPQITLRDHAVQGGVQKISVGKGERARFTVTGDKPDKIHLHGYDIEKELKPGKPVAFSVPAKVDGVFEIESHEAEHLGKPALIGRLFVGPSS